MRPCFWYAILLIKRETAQHLKAMTHTLLLNDAQKFAFTKRFGDRCGFITLERFRRNHRNPQKFEWTGSWTLSVEDARFEWKRLKSLGAVPA